MEGEVTVRDRLLNGSANVTGSFDGRSEQDIRVLSTSYIMYKIGWLSL